MSWFSKKEKKEALPPVDPAKLVEEAIRAIEEGSFDLQKALNEVNTIVQKFDPDLSISIKDDRLNPMYKSNISLIYKNYLIIEWEATKHELANGQLLPNVNSIMLICAYDTESEYYYKNRYAKHFNENLEIQKQEQWLKDNGFLGKDESLKKSDPIIVLSW